MSRPHIADAERLKHSITVRFTDGEFKFLSELSKRHAISRPLIIRGQFRGFKLPYTVLEIPEVNAQCLGELSMFRTEVRRVGVLLNQIARTGGSVDDASDHIADFLSILERAGKTLVELLPEEQE